MLFAELGQTSVAVAETRARSAKIDLLTTCLGALRPDEVPAAMQTIAPTARAIPTACVLVTRSRRKTAARITVMTG